MTFTITTTGANKPKLLRGLNYRKMYGRLVASGSYATGGDVVDFALVAPTRKQPLTVRIMGKSGFIYSYDLANKKVQVWCNTAGAANTALGEHTAAALVAGVTGDVIEFEAYFV